MTSARRFFFIKQQCTKAHIHSYIRRNCERITVFDASGNIVGKIGTIEGAEVNLEIFIGGKIILEEHAKGDQPVGGPAQPATFNRCTVSGMVYRIKLVYLVKIIVKVFSGTHQAKAD